MSSGINHSHFSGYNFMEELKDIMGGLEQRIKAEKKRLQELEKKREKLSDQVATIKEYLEVAETLYRVEVDKAKIASLSNQFPTDGDSSDVVDQARDILLGSDFKNQI